MSGITTHVLDTARGLPAAGVRVKIESVGETRGASLTFEGVTDSDGRMREKLPWTVERGMYRLTFDTASYFAALGIEGFYPEVSVVIEVRDPTQHHHVPLLLSPFGYSTYRGS